MKTLFILALIALAVTSAFAQLDTTCSQCYGQCQQQHAFLQQCQPQMLQASSCQLMRQQCCPQLAQISEQSQCQAVCSVAHVIMQQQQGQSFGQPLQQVQFEVMRMLLQTLPSMCSVYIPQYCTTTPCSTITPTSYIPMVTTCAGGAC